MSHTHEFPYSPPITAVAQAGWLNTWKRGIYDVAIKLSAEAVKTVSAKKRKRRARKRPDADGGGVGV